MCSRKRRRPSCRGGPSAAMCQSQAIVIFVSLSLCTALNVPIGEVADAGRGIAAGLTPEQTQHLQSVIDFETEYHNVSFSLGLVTTTGRHAFTAGYDDRSATGRSTMTTNSRFPMGSVTKSWTAIAVMQHYENGNIDIDAPIAQYVDDIMWRLNHTTMSALWGGNPMVNNITARRLMGMRAGLHDYNDTWYLNWTLTHPDEDWSPFDILHQLNKTFICEPGACGEYASPGYEILGLALCQLANCTNWWDLDQLAPLDAANLRDNYVGVAFPMRGKCRETPNVVHQYAFQTPLDPNWELVAKHVDILNFSCLNGWACGNIAATVADVSQWWWDIFHYKLVQNATLVEMLNGIPLSRGWSPGLSYGLGLMHFVLGKNVDQQNLTWTLGHGGADWGSLAPVNGFNPRFNFSISIAANSVSGMNCSQGYKDRFPAKPNEIYSDEYFMDSSCRIYDAVLQVVTNGTVPRLNCTVPGSGPPPPTTCTLALDAKCPLAKYRGNYTACRHCAMQPQPPTPLPPCSSKEIEYYCLDLPSRYYTNFTCSFSF